jgi:hypothetical protein
VVAARLLLLLLHLMPAIAARLLALPFLSCVLLLLQHRTLGAGRLRCCYLLLQSLALLLLLVR